MKPLAKIQIALTALLLGSFMINMKIAGWLHSMAYSNPVRQEWEARLDSVGSILWFSVLIPWFVFTLYHAGVLIARDRYSTNKH